LPAALVETGFLNGNLETPPGMATASQSAVQLAIAIARGILNYWGEG